MNIPTSLNLKVTQVVCTKETECTFDPHASEMFQNHRTRQVTGSRAQKNLRVLGSVWTKHWPPVRQSLKSLLVHWIY